MTYYHFLSFFLFCLYHVCYMLYMSVLKTMYYVHVWNTICSVLFCYCEVTRCMYWGYKCCKTIKTFVKFEVIKYHRYRLVFYNVVQSEIFRNVILESPTGLPFVPIERLCKLSWGHTNASLLWRRTTRVFMKRVSY